MAVLKRAKRVTDPLDEQVKACIFGKSHHHLHNHDAVDDCSHLDNLIHNYLEQVDHEEEEEKKTQDQSKQDYSSDEKDFTTDMMIKNLLSLHPKEITGSESYRTVLYSQVTKALEIFSCFGSNKTDLMKKTVIFLRDLGYDAGICKSKWESTSGLTSGTYEYIDVQRGTCRYIVDIDFVGEFEIARPTNDYLKLHKNLPKVYVGKSQQLERIVKIVCDEAKKSYEESGLHLPPWRKNRYMQSKWFGSYIRCNSSVNLAQSDVIRCGHKSVVKCSRWSGFDVVNSDTKCRFVVK